MKWTQIAFHIRWNQEESVSLWLDALIAAEICKPVLDGWAFHLTYWRFHRRARADEAGHIFRVSVYMKKADAKRLIEDIEGNSLTVKLLDSGLVNKITTQRKKDVADGAWDLPIQRAWYPFIQGVCGCWVSLVKEFAKDPRQQSDKTLIGLCEVYMSVDKRIGEVWRDDLSHPLLHHLNAIFGYGGMKARVTIPIEF